MTALGSAARLMNSVRVFATALFGQMEVRYDQILTFSEGLCGFANCRDWILIEGKKPGTAWLQSAEYSDLAFLLVDPFVMFDDFSVDLAAHDLARIGATEASEVAVFGIVTLPAAQGDDATVNLQGPVVVNVRARTGVQIVLGDGRWGMRQPLRLDALR